MKHFIRQHPVLTYYLFVFAISWGGILTLIGGPVNIPGTKEQGEKLFVPALLIMFSGPFLSGILMNYLIEGKEGLRKLLAQYFHWRTEARWYAIAVLTGPVLVASVLLGLSFFNQDFLPGILSVKDKMSAVLFGVGWGLIGGGLFEETGWTGFAVPQLRKEHSILSTGLIVGILWGIWHLLIAFWASNYLTGPDSWTLFVTSFIAFYFLALPAYRILLVLAYDRTGSLPIPMLMHAFLSASTIILQPSSTGKVALIWNLALAIILWMIIVLLYITNRLRNAPKTNK